MPALTMTMVFVLSGCGAEDIAKEAAQKATDAATQKVTAVATDAANKAMDVAGEKVKEKAGEMANEMAGKAKGSAADAMKGAVDDMMGTGEETYTLTEVAKHNTQADCWTIVDGTVADVTSFFGVHPGGDDNLIQACGVDATPIWKAVEKHDPNVYKKLMTLKIGTLVQQ